MRSSKLIIPLGLEFCLRLLPLGLNFLSHSLESCLRFFT